MTETIRKTEVKTFQDVANAFDLSIEDLGADESIGDEEIYECGFTNSMSLKEMGGDAYLIKENGKWFVVERVIKF